jgi:hypothetical protein
VPPASGETLTELKPETEITVMLIAGVLESPQAFDVFYKFVLKWEKNQRERYSSMVEFLELVHFLYPSIGRCARPSFMPFYFWRSQKIAFAISKYDSTKLSEVIYDRRKELKDGCQSEFHILYIKTLEVVRTEVWPKFVSSDEGRSIQAELPVSTPAKDRRSSAAPVAASPASAVPGVAIAPGNVKDKPVAISLTPQEAEVHLRLRTEEQLQGIAAVRQQPSAAAIDAVRSLAVAQIRPSASAIAAVRNLPVAPIGQPAAPIVHHRRSPALDLTRRPDPSAARVNGQQSEVQDVFRKQGKCIPASVAAAPPNVAAARKLIAHIQVQPRNANKN